MSNPKIIELLGTLAIPGGGTYGRSTKIDVRNPIMALMALPEAEQIMALSPEQRRALGTLLRLLSPRCRDLAEKSWKKSKAPMALYWAAVAIYAKHLARAIDPRSKPASRKATRAA